MFKKSVLFLFVLTILQVSARYKNVVPDIIDDEINPEPASLSSSRIVSGWVAQPGQHPHHAALRMVNSNGGMRVCGGSIISNEWVLTAARCTVSRVLAVVRVGVVDINDSNPQNIIETTEWYNHPKFNNLSTAIQSHGVTLIKLSRPVVYTWLVKPIRIQSSADAYRNYDGEQVYTSGHGRTEFGFDSDMLRWVYLRAITNNECQRIYTSGVFDTTICARYFNVTSQSTCFGDNGGPLVHVGSDGIPTLIGITNFFPATSIGCNVGRPIGFYRPGAFIPWFKEVTGIDFETYSTTTTTTTTPTTTTSTPTTPTTTTPTTTTSTTTTPTSTTLTSSTSTTTTPTTTTPTTTTPTTTSPTTTTPTTTTPTTTTPTTTTPTTTTPTTTTPTTTTPTTTTTRFTTITTPTTSTIPSITAPPEEEEEDSDSSECNDDDEIGQLLKRLQVDVKVKVALNKYKVMKINDTNVLNH